MWTQQRNIFFVAIVSSLSVSASAAEDGQIRLAGSGSTQCSGRVEIYNNPEWITVSYDGWDLNDAKVVCNELDCGTPVNTTYECGSEPNWFMNVRCTGSERSLTECRYFFRDYMHFNPSSCQYKYAGVVCSEPLQQPKISLTSPNGGLVSGPEGAKITKGSSFVITCSINSSYTSGHFVLISSDSNITKPAVDLSANFSFPAAEYEHQGSYSCVYEIMLPSRTFTSPESEPIHVIITHPIIALMRLVFLPLILFLENVALYFYYKVTTRQEKNTDGCFQG